MSQSKSSRPARPLDTPALEALALGYVGRFATTEAKLARYLKRKVIERGWEDENVPPIAAIVSRFAGAGYINDAEFAEARARSLARRGYGHRRLVMALDAAGVARDITETLTPDRDDAFAAAQAFARRKRFGPFAQSEVTPEQQRRHFAALVRAGHDFELAKFFSGPGRGDTITE